MFIKNLKILNQVTLEIIRNINFNPKGLNLIIDSTSKIANDSGNGVGKTTVIRIIDLCLGAKDLNVLFEDKDTKSINEDLKKYLLDNKVIALLTISDYNSDKEYVLKRELYLKGDRYINDKKYKKDDFTFELKKLIFSSIEKKPTFRQLIPKFIRLQETAENNILRFLSNTTDSEYRSIYSFLFKVMNDEDINSLSLMEKKIKDIKKEINTLKKLNKISSLEALKQKYDLVNDEIKKLKEERNKITYIEVYKDDIEKKIKIETEIKFLQSHLELIDFEIKKIKDTINEINEEKENIDVELLKGIYEESKIYLSSLSKKFKELLNFHNTMIDNRIEFMKKRLNNKEIEKTEKENEILQLLEKTKDIIVDKLEIPVMNKYSNLNNKIEEFMKELGEIENNIEILSKLENEKKEYDEKIINLRNSINSNKNENNIKVFNKIFTDFSEKLYGKKYFLSYNKDNDFPIGIEELNSKLGSGEKKGLMAAFDLAYLEYSNELDIASPKFVIHDKLELTHINQLSSIFEISNGINGQYILPILRERIEKDEKITKKQIEEAKILELTQTSKFFKF